MTMQEFVEFRIPERNALAYLSPSTGQRLGDAVRRVVTPTDNRLFFEIGRLQQALRANNDSFYLGWKYHRRYTQRDLDSAQLFHVWPKRVFEPAGEECGTVYDETGACDYVFARSPEAEICGHLIPASTDTCGVGARQVTPLFLNSRRIPRNRDFSRTIAGEIVASARAVQVFREHGLRGAEFEPVRISNQGGAHSEEYFQMKPAGPYVELDPATRAGSDPFDEHNYGRCPHGHLVGLNLLTEVTVKASTNLGSDVMETRQMVGVRRGLLRPQSVLLLSPRARQAIEDAKLSGMAIEIARLE